MEEKDMVLRFGKEVLLAESKALAAVSQALDDNFTCAVEYALSARKVVVAGIGKSGIIARKISATFSSVGTPSVFLHPVEALHGDIGILEPNDVCILLSKSGNTAELLQLIPYIKQKNVKIISIVGTMNSAIARLSDVALSATVEKEACPLNLAPTASTSAMMGVGDALALAVMKLKNFTAADFAGNHPSGQLGRNLNYKVGEVMHKGNEIPAVSEHATFREALIESSAKALGCVCVLEENHLLGIITDGDIRRILQQYEDIRALSVTQVMTAHPLTIHENALLGEAVALMEHRERQISVLPVVNDSQECVGVLRIHDILRSEV